MGEKGEREWKYNDHNSKEQHVLRNWGVHPLHLNDMVRGNRTGCREGRRDRGPRADRTSQTRDVGGDASITLHGWMSMRGSVDTKGKGERA